MTNWLVIRSKTIPAPCLFTTSFYNIEGSARMLKSQLCFCLYNNFYFKTANLWNEMFVMNLNWNICPNCSILFREWFELKYQLFYKTWRFRNFHAIIKALDAPLNIVRFYSNFFWIFFIIFGTELEGEKMTFITFCFKDQPTVDKRIGTSQVWSTGDISWREWSLRSSTHIETERIYLRHLVTTGKF